MFLSPDFVKMEYRIIKIKIMSVNLNKDKCIGCAGCTQVCPKSFEMDSDGKARVIGESECAPNAAETCPVKAISVE